MFRCSIINPYSGSLKIGIFHGQTLPDDSKCWSQARTVAESEVGEEPTSSAGPAPGGGAIDQTQKQPKLSKKKASVATVGTLRAVGKLKRKSKKGKRKKAK